MGLWAWLTGSVNSKPAPESEYVPEVESDEPERVDALFGPLLRRRGALRGECMLEGVSFEVSFQGGEDEIDSSIALGRAFWPGAAVWIARARAMLIDELFDTAKDWAEEDDATLTVDEFKDAVTPRAFSFDYDGAVDLHFDDGDLFAGHFLTVSGGREAPEQAVMWG